jgi:hypothetical protein
MGSRIGRIAFVAPGARHELLSRRSEQDHISVEIQKALLSVTEGDGLRGFHHAAIRR